MALEDDERRQPMGQRQPQRHIEQARDDAFDTASETVVETFVDTQVGAVGRQQTAVIGYGEDALRPAAGSGVAGIESVLQNNRFVVSYSLQYIVEDKTSRSVGP